MNVHDFFAAVKAAVVGAVLAGLAAVASGGLGVFLDGVQKTDLPLLGAMFLGGFLSYLKGKYEDKPAS